MNIWNISIQNIKSKPLYTVLSVFILSLSIALLLGIQQLKAAFQNQMDNNLGQIDVVVGAKGSPLQLVLASVLHLDNPTGNISYQEAQKIAKNPMVKLAVPISYGDNYKGYRIVGTTAEFYGLYNAELEFGRKVETAMEVVLGHTVAQKMQLKLGDKITSSHGLIDNDIHVHNDELIVVGILKPTEKVVDRLIITNLQSVWDVHNHDSHSHNEEGENQGHADHHHHHKTEVDDSDGIHSGEHQHHTQKNKSHKASNSHTINKNEDKEITSLLIKFKSPRALLTFPRRINKQTNMQAVLPKYELGKLYEYTNVGFQTINWIAYIILVISCITIFISLFKMVKERAFDLAILRTYGATHFQLIKMVLYEGLIIACVAFMLGFIIAKIGLWTLLHAVPSSYQSNILQALQIQNVLQTAGLIFLMVILSVSLAIYPIIKMNISTILSHEK